MFMFLYLIGPGCLTYLLKRKLIGSQEKDKPWKPLLEIIGYSLLNLIITLAVLRPFQKAQLIWKEKSIPIVQYGLTAIAFSIFVSIALVFLELVIRDILLGEKRIRVLKERREIKEHQLNSSKKARWLIFIGQALLFFAISAAAFRIMDQILPEDNQLGKEPTISLVWPDQVLQGFKSRQDVQGIASREGLDILLEGNDITNITDVVINGHYDVNCLFRVFDKPSATDEQEEETQGQGDQEEEEIQYNQTLIVTVPPSYFDNVGEVVLQVEVIDRSLGKRVLSNPVSLYVLSNTEVSLPVITEVSPEKLNTANTKEQWITVKGSGIDENTYLSVNGAVRETKYNSKKGTHAFKLEYSEWCLLDNIIIGAGKKYNGINTAVMSEPYTMEIDHRKVSKKWDESWTDNHYVAMGMGSINDKNATNSLEAFKANYKGGQRVFEVDLSFSADGKLILKNDWKAENYGKLDEDYASYELNDLARTWEDISEASSYTLLTFDELAGLMDKYRDMYIITDMADDNSQAVESTFRRIKRIARKHNDDVLDRIIVQFYNEPMFYQVMNIYPFKSMIYNLSHSEAKDAEVVQLVKQTGIPAVACGKERLSDALTAKLYEEDCLVYLMDVDREKDVEKFSERGVYGFYSNDLSKLNCKVKIDSIRDKYFAEDVDDLIRQEKKAESENNYNAFKQYLKQLKSKNYIVVFSVFGDASRKMTKGLRHILVDYGIDKNALKDPDYSFTAILNNKKCKKQQYGPVSLTKDAWVDGLHIIVKSVGSACKDQFPMSSIKIDGVEESQNQQGLNIVVYDKKTGKVIDSVCYDPNNNYQKYIPEESVEE